MLVILILTAIPLCFTVVNSISMRVVHKRDATQIESKVSILIPMRNEEKHVKDVLNSVSASEHLSDFEIIVLDDRSTDDTAIEIAKFPQIHSYFGIELPDGWLGKNFACHQMVTHSTGEYLVFIDADVRLSTGGISAAISDINRFGWDFISPYPQQLAETFFERLIQPLLQWSWLSSVPLRFAEKSRFPSMVIANGQFFIVRREAYIKAGGHKAIRHEVLDDLELARLLVKHGHVGGVAEGSDVVSCRMYTNRDELFAGYTKSLWRAFGSPFGAIAISVYLFVTGVLPLCLALSGFQQAWFGYFAIVFSRIVSDIRTKSRSNSALLHPLAIVTLIYLIARSWRLKLKGQLVWRGRSVA